MRARVLLCAALILSESRALAATPTGRFTLGARFDDSDGLSEFYGSFRRENPFPAAYEGGSTLRERLARAIVATEGYQNLRSLYEPSPLPALDGPRYALYAVAEGRLRWDNGWSAAGRLATRELSQDAFDGERVQARARNTFFVDEAYLRYSRWDDWRTLAAGRQRLRLADGFVHDDYQTTLRAGADFDLAGWAPLAADVQAAKIEGEHLDESGAGAWDAEGLFDPSESAYLAEVSLAYPISMLESVRLSYARFEERDGYFADLFNPSVGDIVLARSAAETARRLPGIVEYVAGECRRRFGAATEECVVRGSDLVLGQMALKQYGEIVAPAYAGPIGGGRSFLNYAVLDGRKFLGKLTAAWTVVGQWGRVTLTDISPVLRRETAQGFQPLPDRIDFPAVGLLGYGVLAYEPAPAWRLRAHYLFSSGDVPGADLLSGETYQSFIGVRPYVTLTNIFFSGGISENLRTGSLSPSGYYGHGVYAPVLDALWAPRDDLSVSVTGAYLHAQRDPAPSEGAGRNGEYGWEADLMAAYAPLPWLAVSVEGDYFATGDFFTGMPDIWKAAAGLDLTFDAD